ncbi:MAG: YkgJ family cysteine cluster protein [Desulfamplus sp.]|nr:YkgJ family cysteine cluster protein [Desulfamplus sp.]
MSEKQAANGKQGTYHSCAVCPADNNCCSKFNVNDGGIQNAFLFISEIDRVEEYTGIDRYTFIESKKYPDAKVIYYIKSSEHVCFFYQNNKCVIYPVRPIICSLFPFDLKEHNGNLRWVFYTQICTIPFNYSKHFENAKTALKHSGIIKREIIAYIQEDGPSMAHHAYIDLGPVELC